MGTTLTGTTPQDTYDSLIKVTDNGPLSATGKYLSDGLGNDSALALSTTKVGINTSSPEANLHISGDAANRAVLRLASTAANRLAAVTFYGNNVESAVIGYEGGSEIISGGVQGDLVIRNVLAGKDIILDTNAGNVGIGISAPTAKLHSLSASSDYAITAENTLVGQQNFLLFRAGANIGDINRPSGTNDVRLNANFGSFVFGTDSAGSPAERFRITNNGVTFNGDTAAANALDDYEEGTWTPVLRGSSTAGTYELSTASGNYTKIGRQVSVNCRITLAASITGGGSGYAQITGLPFNNGSVSIGCLRFAGVDFVGNFVNVSFIAASGVSIVYFPESVDNAPTNDLDISGFVASDTVDFSVTYFV